jgi:hypothetical protein
VVHIVTDDSNILAFCREEVDAAGLLPEPPGEHATGALVADLRGSASSPAVSIISGLSLAAVAALVLIGVGLVRDANLYPHPIPPIVETGLPVTEQIQSATRAEPVPAKAGIDRAQFEAWIATLTPRRSPPRPSRPHYQVHRRPVPLPAPVSHPVTASDYGCPASLSPTICGRR